MFSVTVSLMYASYYGGRFFPPHFYSINSKNKFKTSEKFASAVRQNTLFMKIIYKNKS